MRVIVTRPAAQAEAAVASLRAQGVDAVALPLLDILPLADAAPLRRAWQALTSTAMVFFVSPSAVQHFFAARPDGLAWPAGTLAAAPGPGTQAALRAAGVPDAAIAAPPPDAQRFDSEALWQTVCDQDWAGRRVLVVRGEDGRDWLGEQLRGAGAEVTPLAAYARRAPTRNAAATALLAQARSAPQQHLWWFSSSEAVRHLRDLWGAPPPGARSLATHPRIAQAARAAGFDAVGLVAPGEAALRRALDPAQGGGRSIQSSDP